MKFNISLSPQEKKSVYTQVREGIEKSLYVLLLSSGIDPETFDESAFEVRRFENGDFNGDDLTIKSHIDRLAEINRKIEEL